jgi:hypothetical protein
VVLPADEDAALPLDPGGARGHDCSASHRYGLQYIDGQPARIHEDFNRFAVEALRVNWPCSLAAGARDPLAVAPY